MPSNSDLKRWYKVFKVKDRDFVRYDKNFRILCFDAINDFHAVNLGQMNEAIQKAIQSHAYDVKVKKIDFPYGELTNLTYDTDDGLSMFGTTRLTEIDDETVDIETTRSVPLRAIDGLSMDVSEDGKHIEISGKEKSNATNLENGTGIGSLVQKTLSSNGTPYDNEASGSGAVAFGKNTKANGNCAFTIGQLNSNEIGSASFVANYYNKNEGNFNAIFGWSNYGKANCRASAIFGYSNEANKDFKLTCGVYNNDKDNYFEVGNGSNTDRENCFAVSKKGNVFVGDYNNTENSGTNTLVVGNGNTIGNTYQLIVGEGNTNVYRDGVVLGVGLHNNSNMQFVCGSFNKYQYSDHSNSPIFVVGNGLNPSGLSNAFEVYKDGRAKVQSAPVDSDDVVRKQELDSVKIIANNAVVANSTITAGTHTKITYDSKGLVTGGTELAASDIPNLSASKITSGTFSDDRIASASVWNAKLDSSEFSVLTQSQVDSLF